MTLVFLHGFLGTPASWDDVIAGLPTSMRILRPVLLGHGAASNATTFDGEVDRLASLLRAEDVSQAHVVGYSLGARLALGLLARHALFERATLVSPSPGLESKLARASRRDEDEMRARTLEAHGVAAFVDAWEREPLFATQRALPAEVRSRHRARRTSHDAAGIATSLRVLGTGSMPELWSALPRIAARVSLVVGGEDAKFGAIAARMRTAMPEARLTVVHGAGHDVVLERPADVAAAIMENAR